MKFVCHGILLMWLVFPLMSLAKPLVPERESRTITFEDLGAQKPLDIWGMRGSNQVTFSVRNDEYVHSAHLRLSYSWSPSLIPERSHLRVLLNEHVVATLPLPKDQAGTPVTQDIPLDPHLMGDYNQLRFQLLGYYTDRCQDPVSPLLWVHVSNLSELTLDVRPLQQVDDLALFPEPFFDRRDNDRLVLPFILSEKPDGQTLEAAAILASWFGQQAEWRGADFPVRESLDEVTRRYSLLVATVDQLPQLLGPSSIPSLEVKGPTVRVITHPDDPYAKILLILGRNSGELRQAAVALSTGDALLTGDHVTFSKAVRLQPRKPYDAPRWVRLDRPVKLGELADNRALNVTGHSPPPITVDLRIPPDLFFWNTKGIPLDLKYRYSPPVDLDESRLNIFLNDKFVESFKLFEEGHGGIKQRVRIPAPGAILPGGNPLLIPPYELGMRNQLRFNFSFAYHKEGECKDTVLDNTVAAIDEDSQIDFSDYPHYVMMPNLHFLTEIGYPYTRLADLSDTLLVLPAQADRETLRLMLVTMGRMGDATGYPVTGINVVMADDFPEKTDKDILIIGSRPTGTLLERWGLEVDNGLFEGLGLFSTPARAAVERFDPVGFETAPDPTPATRVEGDPAGPLSAMVSFESPVSSGRTVTAFLGNGPRAIQSLVDAQLDGGIRSGIHGSATFFRGSQVENTEHVLVGDTYYIGDISPLTLLWFKLSKHTGWLIFLSLVVLLIFGTLLWILLRRQAARRLEGGTP
ncbi:MAG: cellulose biosynthesis cyclic di-GMP-binding regulatory protein BcsB [Gammaproteobacteria bacterium]|nr:MAG: cellulose biosynthesis cyclic di-GMP-binding regulatory protein BcsB [Gammaproteobacteria bacterium]